MMRTALPAYFGKKAPLPEIDLDLDIQTYLSVIASLEDFSLWHALEHMGALSMIFGARDYIFIEDYQERVGSDARIKRMEAGHFACNECPEAIQAEITDYLNWLPPA